VIVACPEHGAVEGERCPICGAEGRRLLDRDRRVRLSRFLSGALRHFPDDLGLSLDERGWTDLEALLDAAADRYEWADAERVKAVLATDPKGRFDRAGDRVRATYGHSVAVTLASAGSDSSVPDRLYHGTAPERVTPIREEGLRPMGRQLVHLSDSPEAAREVGERHAEAPVVLVVDAARLVEHGHEVVPRGTDTYTVERVPPDYLRVLDGPDGGDGAGRTGTEGE
jgi:putative RNA 2'-phosphotransferase